MLLIASVVKSEVAMLKLGLSGQLVIGPRRAFGSDRLEAALGSEWRVSLNTSMLSFWASMHP